MKAYLYSLIKILDPSRSHTLLLIGLLLGFGQLGLSQDLASLEKRSASIMQEKVVKQQKTLSQALQELERSYQITFTYENKLINGKWVANEPAEKGGLQEKLIALLAPFGLQYKKLGKTIYSIGPAKPEETKRVPVKLNSSQSLLQGTDTRDVSISGKITNEDGEGMVGVTVVVKGSALGTSADAEGNYSLIVPDGKGILVFSFIGYIPQEIAINNRTRIDVQLKVDAKALEEVVVVGYGSVKKSDLTGAVSTIKAEELLDKPAVNIGQALSGKLAGVEVFGNSGRPDGQVRIRIRGNNSITASNEPLYVIDGVIGVADINLINPNNIESLEVLKDASATAIYGARGANGVILITTKRGISSDKGIIAYDGLTSIGVIAKKQNIEFLNAQEWWQVYNTGFDNIEKYDPIGFAQGKFKRVSPQDLPKLFDSAGNPLYDTDWEEEAYRTAISQNHQISFRGGNDKTVHSIYLGYLNQQALMKENYLERYNAQFNIDSKLRSWIKVGGNLAFNYNKGNDLYGNYSLKRLAQEALPIIPVKYPDGTWGSNRDFPGAVQDTPSRYLEEMIDETTNTQFIADFYLLFQLAKNLDFKSTFAIDNKNRKNNYYTGKNLIQFSGKTNGGIARINTESQFYWQNENYFNWNKQFNEFNKINLMLGLSWQQRSAELLGAEHRNFIDDFYQWHNLGTGTVNQPATSGDWRWSLNSYFARANYNIKDRYLFTATGRYDGSSKFGGNNKYAFFPSFAFAWRASEESLLKRHLNSIFIEDLKIRTSVGRTGNQDVANYAYSQNLGSSNVIFKDEFYAALFRSSFGNPDLKWETTTQVDGGIDISLLKGRIDLSLDYYHKTTDDLLLNAPIPYTSGLNSVMKNIGSVRNKGFEAELNTFNITSNDFNWSSSIAFAKNKNRIIKLGANNEDIFPTRHATGEMQILRVGEAVGAFWGLTRLGTWGTHEADEAAQYNRLPGDLKYADLNTDGKIDANDNSVIGNSLPDWTMGISNTFTYKNIDLSFDIRLVQGLDVMNAGTHTREDRSGVANGSKTILNAWTPTNQNTMVAELRYMKTYYDSYPDSHWLQDGSFTRLQNILLGYNFSEPIANKMKLQKLRVYASGQNLLLLTDYKGYDPEVSTFGGAFGQGIDDFGEPRARTYTIGINVNF